MNSIPRFIIYTKEFIFVKQLTLDKFNSSFYKISMVTKPLHLKWDPATLLHQVQLTYAEVELDTVGLYCSTQHIQVYRVAQKNVYTLYSSISLE